MRSSFALASAVLALSFASSALAGAPCTKHPKEEWLPEAEMKKRIEGAGYKIKKFKIDGNCYEIYGWNSAGDKVEIYYDTKTGDVVKSNEKKKPDASATPAAK